MRSKKTLALFGAALFSILLLFALFNILTDPFGTFGDPLMHWDSYTQTLNPRNSKIGYISKHFDDFDSYIIGSSSAASYLPEVLDGYTGTSSYNMFHYGADTGYDVRLAEYLLENDSDVKQIFYVIGLNEADLAPTKCGFGASLTDKSSPKLTGESPLSYYASFLFADPRYGIEKLESRKKDTVMPQTFDVFLPESGTYDKRLRDAESIGSLDAYMEKNGSRFVSYESGNVLSYIDESVENITEIKKLCKRHAVKFTLVLSPVSSHQLDSINRSSLDRFYKKLASHTEYYDFSVSPVSYDERYFYDISHTRNATASMVMAKIFGDDSVYTPESFGALVKDERDVLSVKSRISAAKETKASHTATLPVIMYHNFSETETENNTRMHPGRLWYHLYILERDGYHPVGIDDVIAYVYEGKELPEKPVLITFDDGYYSNYEFAYPWLKERGYPGVIFTIGCSIGHDKYYKETDFEMTPHFGMKESRKMVMSGIISLQSHTYDMHMWKPFEDEDTEPRDNILRKEGETEKDYIASLEYDMARQNEAFLSMGIEEPKALAFPEGEYDLLADVILQQNGIKATFTTDRTRVNTLVKGLPQSLVDLGRLNLAPWTSERTMLDYLRRTAE